MAAVEKPLSTLPPQHLPRPNRPSDMQPHLFSKGYPEPQGQLPDAPKNAKSPPATGTKANVSPVQITVNTPMSEVLRHPSAKGASFLATKWAATVQSHPGLVPENVRSAATQLASLIHTGKWTLKDANDFIGKNPQLKDLLSQPSYKLIVSGIRSSVEAEAIIDKDPQLKNDPAKAQILRDNVDKAEGGDPAARGRITDQQWTTARDAWIAHQPGAEPPPSH